MKKGFTLAEVLITLAIIGIVAALTIPTVVAKYNQHAQYTQFMKMYNTLSTAFSLASAENSPISWDYSAQNIPNLFNDYIAPHLKISDRGNAVDNFSDGIFRNLSGADYVSVETVCSAFTCSDAASLQDGSTIFIANGSDSSAEDGHEYIQVIFDTNSSKKPNILGRDQFFLEFGYYTDDNNEKKQYFGILDEEGFSCGQNDSTGCALKLLKEGKMNY